MENKPKSKLTFTIIMIVLVATMIVIAGFLGGAIKHKEIQNNLKVGIDTCADVESEARLETAEGSKDIIWRCVKPAN